MSRWQIAWFAVGYLGVVALAIGLGLAGFCLGAPQHGAGCGGFRIYIPLWEMFLLPLPLSAIAIERWWGGRTPDARLFGYLAGILAIAGIGFVVIEKFPVLLAIEAAAIAATASWRRRAQHG